MIERLSAEIEEKYESLSLELADPDIHRDQSRYAEVSKTHADLKEAYELAVAFREARVSLARSRDHAGRGWARPRHEGVRCRGER